MAPKDNHREPVFPTPENNEFFQQFQYDNLGDPSEQHIRLIKPSVDKKDGLMQCKLLPAAPLSILKGKYRAISYCAGDPTRTKPILLSGRKFNKEEGREDALALKGFSPLARAGAGALFYDARQNKKVFESLPFPRVYIHRGRENLDYRTSDEDSDYESTGYEESECERSEYEYSEYEDS
ncbi:hypothetical protein OQA88_2168 [Cercophora sp. LCS_1]